MVDRATLWRGLDFERRVRSYAVGLLIEEPPMTASDDLVAPDGASSCTDGDLAAYRRFLVRLYGEHHRQADEGYIRWLYDEIPVHRSADRALWVYRQDGQIVAARGSIPFELKAGDETWTASWSVDVVADPGVRGSGISYELADAARTDDRVSCGVGLSEDGYRFALRRGFADMGRVPLHVCLLDARRLSQYFETSRTKQRLGGPFVAAFTNFVGLAHRIRRNGVKLVPIEEFDDRADTLWREVSAGYEVIARRDSRWLAWRFDLSPDRDHYCRYYLSKNDHLVGYLVLRSASWHDLPAIEIVDYLAAPPHLPALFACAADVGRREHAAALLCITLNPQARWPLRSLGFFVRSRGPRFVTRVPSLDPAHRVVSDPTRWFLTTADSDLEGCAPPPPGR